MPIQLLDYTVQSTTFKPVNNTKIITKGISSSSFLKLWNEGYTGKNVLVAIIDTGVDNNHPDLTNKIVKSINLTSEGITDYHGTHVAGTICANGTLQGGAYDCKILDIKVLGKNGGTSDTLAKAITLAVDSGAQIINMSLGTVNIASSEIQLITNAIKYAWNKGCICVCASGNHGTSVNTSDPYSYPASVDISESVGACEIDENLNVAGLAYFSGENDKVDLAACGKSVLSCFSNNGYGVLSGTSMATPHVAAMAACLAQKINQQKQQALQVINSQKLNTAMNNSYSRHIYTVNPRLQKYIQRNDFMIKDEVKYSALEGANFSTSLVNELNKNLLLINNSENISFGKGFLRYDPRTTPIVPPGNKVYDNGIFIGHNTN